MARKVRQMKICSGRTSRFTGFASVIIKRSYSPLSRITCTAAFREGLSSQWLPTALVCRLVPGGVNIYALDLELH